MILIIYDLKCICYMNFVLLGSVYYVYLSLKVNILYLQEDIHYFIIEFKDSYTLYTRNR